MRVFQTRVFAGVARKCNVGDPALWHAAMQANAGMVAADLGGEVVQLRLARGATGKPGGFRTFTLLRPGLRAVFIHGLAKNERADLHRDEMAALWRLAKLILSYTDGEMAAAVKTGALIEVLDDQAIP
jgi:hypothetical protein